MEKNYRRSRLDGDTAATTFLDILEGSEQELGLQESYVYAKFPLYREEDEIVAADFLVVSKAHGVVLFGTCNTNSVDAQDDLEDDIERLEKAFSLIYSRLIKSRLLQASRRELKFPTNLAIFAPHVDIPDFRVGVDILGTSPDVERFLRSITGKQIEPDVLLEIVSIIEGAKGLLRPRDRDTKNRPPDSKVVLVAQLETEIRRFDKDQKEGYFAPLDGPQRIRGLAGSGKTVVLAMKAALTHMQYPDATIAYTFYTKSLYQHVKRLITRFYRQFDDRDPNWDKLQVLHAWGGQTNPGIYFNACRALGVSPITYGDAKSQSKAAFDYVCKDLLSRSKVKPIYDYVFVDEGQDFAPSFTRLALALARKNRVVLAYDELQNIFQLEAPTAATIFGVDNEGRPLVQFEEDVVLHKCYRNPREVLVAAHAIGLGVYDKIVQLPENEQHWEDLGYKVKQGPLEIGREIVISRPEANSPSSISDKQTKAEMVVAKSFLGVKEEILWVAQQIENDIRDGGLSPEDILVVTADDRNGKLYFDALERQLLGRGIELNNLQSDSFGLRDFTETGKVTYSTVYKAKGNEGYVVFVLGIDAIFWAKTIRNRNVAFTAMTRAKGWLRVTGVGVFADSFKKEVDASLAEFPRLRFVYPGPDQLSLLKRDISEEMLHGAQRSLEDLEGTIPSDLYEDLLRRKLAELTRKKRRPKPKKA
jgi:superfamily I DNA and RNA helicase